MKLALSRVHFPVHTLGPGARVAIWFQGCSIRCCTGCISVDTWEPRPPDTSVEDLLVVLRPWLARADGVTITGGEPFDQPESLRSLLRAIRAEHTGDILVYSGRSLEALEPLLASYAPSIDAVMADPFDRTAPQTLALRGSDNQRLAVLTPLGRERLLRFERCAADPAGELDIMFDDASGEVWLAGIPRRGDMRRLAALMEAQGHEAEVTEGGPTQ